MPFNPCDRSACVNISIPNDEIVEESEMIAIRLERTVGLSNRISLVTSSGVIEVTDDNEGMY